MTWTRLSDDFTLRPAVLGLSDTAFRLHIEALVFCNQQLTDGVFPALLTSRWTDSNSLNDIVSELVIADLWTADGDNFLIRDWASEQETRASVEARRREGGARQARSRERYKLHSRGDHTSCLPSMCRGAETRDKRVTDNDPTQPDPTPKGKGKGGATSPRAETRDLGSPNFVNACTDDACDGHGWHNIDGMAQRCPVWAEG
jgi:hypothetical protein